MNFKGAVLRRTYLTHASPNHRQALCGANDPTSAIDAESRIVTTDAGTHEADVLVIALGADYDLEATPGLAENGNEF